MMQFNYDVDRLFKHEKKDVLALLRLIELQQELHYLEEIISHMKMEREKTL
jgi:hypothetical protein